MRKRDHGSVQADAGTSGVMPGMFPAEATGSFGVIWRPARFEIAYNPFELPPSTAYFFGCGRLTFQSEHNIIIASVLQLFSCFLKDLLLLWLGTASKANFVGHTASFT
jgi:hypothetical protein